MFRKILIANRGEIACRIMATARKLGVQTVAVYSDADRTARHVALADQAVAIGGPAPRDSYLRGDAIIAAAHATGAEAIHPGYGFLSENPDFVDAVTKAGLIFIGPSADAIRAMGLKDAAKGLMEKAGVPVVPGYHGADQDPAHLARQASSIGYPVLIKAVAGGGGKGMRRVDDAAGFDAALRSAMGEAKTAFGNDAVLIEKYVEKPRHIEIQVFGDGTDAVHLFERDCSLQRRHQKVIEEAPAPGMTPEMRDAMGQAAVRAARAIGYSGAGTVEFIVDASDGLRLDRFWFMEMNTRLQVEHPVTEAITGIDLVEWQLRVASGEALPAAQSGLAINGHAFEARVYAEDVPAGFLPATGRLDHLAFAQGVRVDTGVREGDVISPWYDPMIAKVITHAPTRAMALQQLRHALAQTQIAGSVTNLDFLGALARDPAFAAGDVDTGLIARKLDGLVQLPKARPAVAVAAALMAAGLWDMAAPDAGFVLWAPMRRRVPLMQGGALIHATLVCHCAGHITVEVEGITHQAVRAAHGWVIDDQPGPLAVRQIGQRVHVLDAGCHSFVIPDPLDRQAQAGAGGDVTLSPMPGLVKSVFVAAGQAVRTGDPLAVLEAMKMEHTLVAARDGLVAEVLTEAGAQVEAGAALIRLGPAA